MINEIPCGKGCISSNDNKNIDTIVEKFSVFNVTYTPPPWGCTKKLKTIGSLFAKWVGWPGSGWKNQSEIECVFKQTE